MDGSGLLFFAIGGICVYLICLIGRTPKRSSAKPAGTAVGKTPAEEAISGSGQTEIAAVEAPADEKTLSITKDPAEITIFEFSQPESAAELFFDNTSIKSAEGAPLTEDQKTEAIKKIGKFAQQLYGVRSKAAKSERRGQAEVTSGRISEVYYYNKDSYETCDHCYDGGNCSCDECTEYVTTTEALVFYRLGEREEWPALKECQAKESAGRSREEQKNIHSDCLRIWGLEQTLSGDFLEMIITRSKLYLLDPFGMEGVFVYSIDQNVERNTVYSVHYL